MTNFDPRIRPATPEDARLLGAMLYEFNLEFGEEEPPAEVFARLAGPQIASGEVAALFGGEGPDGAQGFAQLRFRGSLYTPGPDACLEELWVKPPFRGTGLGRALLEAAMELARERGADRMELNTSVDDREARALYESCGFTNREGGPDGPSMLYYEREL